MNLSWSTNNAKLKKLRTVSFGLPALRSADGFVTCPGAGACARFCFARQGWYVLPRVQRPRERNLAQARLCDEGRAHEFVDLVLLDLASMPRFRVVRIHDSGDFFSQAYLDAWISIATRAPRHTFYAYTKSLHLDFSGAPKNFLIVQSEDGKYAHLLDDDAPTARVFKDHATREEAGYVDAHESDAPVLDGFKRIGLVYHGNKAHVQLTDELEGKIA